MKNKEHRFDIESICEDIFLIIQCHSPNGKFESRYPFRLPDHPILAEVAKFFDKSIRAAQLEVLERVEKMIEK